MIVGVSDILLYILKKKQILCENCHLNSSETLVFDWK